MRNGSKKMSQDDDIFRCDSICAQVRELVSIPTTWTLTATGRDVTITLAPILREFVPRWRRLEVHMTDQIESLKWEATTLAASAAAAREVGDETLAERHFRRAFELALDCVHQMADNPSHPGRLET